MNNVWIGFILENLDTHNMMKIILGSHKEKHPDKKQMSVYAN